MTTRSLKPKDSAWCPNRKPEDLLVPAEEKGLSSSTGRTVHCADGVRPDSDHLILGDFLTTLPAFRERMGRRAVLAHADIGSDDPERDEHLAAAVAPLIDGLVQPQGLILSDRAMSVPEWVSLPLPSDAGDWPYHIYQAA